MRKMLVGALALVLAVAATPAVFERYLSTERPEDRAILAYLELAKQKKASSRDLAELAVLLLDKGFPAYAEDYLREALKVDKRDFEAAYRLGLVLQRMGRDREAIRYYRRVIKERPGHAYARFMLALAEERSGRRGEAIADYAAAYRFVPELAVPAKNPLVLDSRLQAEAQLMHYREVVATSTLAVNAIDPEWVKKMMIARPPEPEATPTPDPEATPEPAATPTPAVSPTAAAKADTKPARSGQKPVTSKPGAAAAPLTGSGSSSSSAPGGSGQPPAGQPRPTATPAPGRGGPTSSGGPILNVRNTSSSARLSLEPVALEQVGWLMF